MTTHEVIIIGSGVAGLTAAIYCARAMLEPIVIAGNWGGQLMTTLDVENFPGYVNGVEGPELMSYLNKQSQRFGTKIIREMVKDIDTSSRPFKITLCNNEQMLAKSIIVATGATALWLDLDGEKELRSAGITTCAVCDGAFFKDEDIIVIGGGDTAMEEAIFLTRYAKKVTIVHRREEFRASKIMLERARNNPKIFWKTSAKVKSWLSDNKNLSGVVLETNQGDERIECTGAFIAIGHVPATSFLNEEIEKDEDGYIILKEYTSTSVPGIFACGDVCDRRYKQAITAAGQGAAAALDATAYFRIVFRMMVIRFLI